MTTRTTAKTFAELTVERTKPPATAAVLAFTGYECSRCGCRFPETRPATGRTRAETERLAEAHAAREFALHVCAERGWPPVRRKT